MLKCALCDCEGDTESPFMDALVMVVNPRTFRVAWLCGYCFEDELDNLTCEPASTPEYQDRRDEYVTRFL